MRAFLHRLSLLLPWRRRAAERDMREELQAIASMAEPRELGNLTMAAEDARAEWSWTRIELLPEPGFRNFHRLTARGRHRPLGSQGYASAQNSLHDAEQQ